MTKRKGQNKLWWFISWLQVILLALPLLDVAKNCVFNTISTYDVIETNLTAFDNSVSDFPVTTHTYLGSENDLLNYSLGETYFYFTSQFVYPYADETMYLATFEDYLSYLDDYDFDEYWNFRICDYNITHFDFLFANFSDVDFTFFGTSNTSILKIYFLNWYMNYILTILIVFFIPYLLVFIFSWFSSFAEGFINKSTKGDD